jgi:hypothetical protein
MMDNQIGKKPFGYIYVSFFPPTETTPFERFYVGQRILSKRNYYSFEPSYHGSGTIVRKYRKAYPKAKINTVCLIYAYSLEELNALEHYWVSDYYDHKSHPDSLNLRAGGHQKGMTDEIKAKISLKTKGYKHTDEARRRISMALKGRQFTTETRIRQSAAQKGRNHSELRKQKIAEGTKKYFSLHPETCHALAMNNPRRKAVICLETKEVFASSLDAARFYTNIDSSCIRKCCKKTKGYLTAGGFHWDFIEENPVPV